MKRLSLCIFGAIGLFCVSSLANILTFAAPPFAPEFHRYQHIYNYRPFYVSPRIQVVPNVGGVTYPLAASEIEANNTEYIVTPQASTQVAPITKAPVAQFRAGRYYTTEPTEPTVTAESHFNDSTPILAPTLSNQDSTNRAQIISPRSISTPSLTNSFTAGSTKTDSKNVIENTSQLDFLNARLAKMQLEKKNLDGTLHSIDKIENVAFKVQTLVDLAEYVSRDKNYKKEAEHLFELALAATDAFAKNQPVIITFPNSASTKPNQDVKNSPPANKPKKNTPPSNPIENAPDTANTEIDQYLLNDPLPNSTTKKDNVAPKLDLITPDLKKDEPTKTKTNDKDIFGLPEKTTNPLLPKTDTTDTTTESNKEKKTVIDIPNNSDLENSLIEQPKKKKERKPLIKESDNLLELDGGNNSGNKSTKSNTTQPPLIINQVSPDGSKIKLPEATKMTLEEYNKLNQNSTTSKTTQDSKIEKKPENSTGATDLLTTPNTDDQTKQKKKPNRPQRKPLISN
ncbi:MAG: hypothetical protein LBC74_16375 [Planctomycetaceae bacterium]|jgi:hypothetical protein|nr:hypothetical protein [Planctomycetaceae bacterium]